MLNKWQKKNGVTDEKTRGWRRPPPSLPLPCLRLCRHHAHMCFNMWAWCRYIQRRFERTHGDVLNGLTGVSSEPHRTQHNTQHHTDTETETERDIKGRQKKREKRRRKRRDKTEEERQETRQEKRRQDQHFKRREKREERREKRERREERREKRRCVVCGCVVLTFPVFLLFSNDQTLH